MTIGNFNAASIALTAVVITETLFIIICLLVSLLQTRRNRILMQEISFSLSVAGKLRSLIAEKSRESVLRVTNALGELELLEEEINEKIYANTGSESDNDGPKIVGAIDEALCQCLESLQFEDYTNQIREHIQILENSLVPDSNGSAVSDSVKKEISEKCRQIFSINEEYAVLNHSREDNNEHFNN